MTMNAAKQRRKHNQRVQRKMYLSSLEGRELADWLTARRQILVERTEALLKLLAGLRMLAGVNAQNPSGSVEQLDQWIAKVQKSIDDLSMSGPDGCPIPFGRIERAPHMDATLRRTLELTELVMRVAHTQASEVQEALEHCWPRWVAKRTLRRVDGMRAQLEAVARDLREAIER